MRRVQCNTLHLHQISNQNRNNHSKHAEYTQWYARLCWLLFSLAEHGSGRDRAAWWSQRRYAALSLSHRLVIFFHRHRSSSQHLAYIVHWHWRHCTVTADAKQRISEHAPHTRGQLDGNRSLVEMWVKSTGMQECCRQTADPLRYLRTITFINNKSNNDGKKREKATISTYMYEQCHQ